MVTTEEECIAAAERIGYPVMLKASEGGGGKGIRMSKDAELRNNFVQVTNEVPGARRRPFRRHRRDASPTRNSAIDATRRLLATTNSRSNHAQARPCSSCSCAPTRDIWRCRSSGQAMARPWLNGRDCSTQGASRIFEERGRRPGVFREMELGGAWRVHWLFRCRHGRVLVSCGHEKYYFLN